MGKHKSEIEHGRPATEWPAWQTLNLTLDHYRLPKNCWRSTTPIWPTGPSSRLWSATWTAAQSYLWCGKVWTSSKPAAFCSVKPTQPTPPQEPSEEICAFKLDVTSSTDLTPLNLPTRKLPCGSVRRRLSAGPQPGTNGLTKETKHFIHSYLLFLFIFNKRKFC